MAVTHTTTPPRPGVGDRAPDFTLRHTFTKQVTLADRWPRGPVVLAPYGAVRRPADDRVDEAFERVGHGLRTHVRDTVRRACR